MNFGRMGLAIVGMLLTGSIVAAQEEIPAVTIWTPSLNAFLDQGKLLMGQIGQSDAAAKLAEQAAIKLGNRGFAGIDGSRPVGAFLRFTPDPSGAIVVPISTEKDFFDLLGRFDIPSMKEPDGTYRLAVPIPIAVYAKVTAKDAWITILNKSAFEAKIDPAKIFVGPPALVSARVRIDGIPKDARQLAISQFEESLQQAMKKNDAAGTAAQKAFVEASNQAIARLFAQTLEEGKLLSLDVTFDAKQKDVSANLSLVPQKGTAFAKSLGEAGQRASVFGPANASEPLAARINLALPEPIAKAFSQLVQESFTETAGKFGDEMKKAQAQELFAALKPSLDAGEIDAIFRVVGPSADRKVGAIVGLQAKNGDRLGTLFKSMADDAKKVMNEADRAKIQLDAEEVGATKIHRFVLAADQGKKALDAFGDPTLSIAFRPDAVLAGIGFESKTAIKALAVPGKAAIAPMAGLRLDCAAMAPLMFADKAANAKATFAQPGDSIVQLVVTGGEQLNATLSIRTPVLRFLSQNRKP